MLVVDQLREPLLERYDDLFTGGFRRLLDRGRFYTRAAHDHGGTITAPGHATLGTGVHPSATASSRTSGTSRRLTAGAR